MKNRQLKLSDTAKGKMIADGYYTASENGYSFLLKLIFECTMGILLQDFY